MALGSRLGLDLITHLQRSVRFGGFVDMDADLFAGCILYGVVLAVHLQKMPDVIKRLCKAQTKAVNRAKQAIARMFGSGDKIKRRPYLIYGLVNRGSGVGQNNVQEIDRIEIWKNIKAKIQ